MTGGRLTGRKLLLRHILLARRLILLLIDGWRQDLFRRRRRRRRRRSRLLRRRRGGLGLVFLVLRRRAFRVLHVALVLRRLLLLRSKHLDRVGVIIEEEGVLVVHLDAVLHRSDVGAMADYNRLNFRFLLRRSATSTPSWLTVLSIYQLVPRLAALCTSVQSVLLLPVDQNAELKITRL